MRKITIVSTQTDDVFDIESSAETWGELMRHDRLVGANNMKATVRETRNSLDLPEAILPAGDFTLYLSPTKVKSGWSAQDLEDMDDLIDFLEDNDASKHLVRFVEGLRRNGGETSSYNKVETVFPITSSGPTKATSDPRKEELLNEARRLNR